MQGHPQHKRAPVLVLNAQTKRETGTKAQLGNITAAATVASVIRTCLGPRSMLKMILAAHGGIVLTNDGNAILRELDVAHPAAKTMLELSRAQDEEVGDGTTSVVVLAGELLKLAAPWLEKQLHPTILIAGYTAALHDALEHLNTLATDVDLDNREQLLSIVRSTLGTKFVGRWGDLMCNLAIDAVRTVAFKDNGKFNVDTKRYARVEKIPGGDIKDSRVLSGVMINKDVLHSKMRRRIENPRIILLDQPLEYKKNESQTSFDVKNPDAWTAMLQEEEAYIKKMCDEIIAFKPDIVITEKGLSDLAQHFFIKHNITALRRFRKTDNNRLARCTGATIISRTTELKESDVGTKCGLYEVRKIGDEYFSFFVECEEPKACTILLRGASKDVLSEIERNLQDAMAVVRNVFLEPKLVPGGGSTEMSIAHHLSEKSKSIEGIKQYPYLSAGIGFEVIPRTLAQNCGAKTVRILTELRAKHAQDPVGNAAWGVDGDSGVITDISKLGIWEPFVVKSQTIKSAIENACMLLRVDDIVSGVSKKKGQGQGMDAGPTNPEAMM